MAEMESREVSGSDIQSVGEKLKQLHQSLSPNEQIVLEWLLNRAAKADETQGYGAYDLSYFKLDSAGDLGGALGISGPIAPGAQFANKYAQKEA